MLPMALLLCVLVPWGWVCRLDGISTKNKQLQTKGYRILSVCFLIGLIFLIFEDGTNHVVAK
jgi:hypothetical protein